LTTVTVKGTLFTAAPLPVPTVAVTLIVYVVVFTLFEGEFDPHPIP